MIPTNYNNIGSLLRCLAIKITRIGFLSLSLPFFFSKLRYHPQNIKLTKKFVSILPFFILIRIKNKQVLVQTYTHKDLQTDIKNLLPSTPRSQLCNRQQLFITVVDLINTWHQWIIMVKDLFCYFYPLKWQERVFQACLSHLLEFKEIVFKIMIPASNYWTHQNWIYIINW